MEVFILTNPIFNIKDLTYYNYNGKIENINLNIDYQEIHALVSNNSSELNLFLQVLMDLSDPKIEGEIIFNQKNLKLNKTPLSKHKISLLHHNPMLIQNLSVAENLHLTKLPKSKLTFLVSWKKVRDDSIKFLREMDVHINVNTKVKYLSEENKKIVYIASIFFQKPKMIIMHEAMEGLSVNSISKVNKLLDQYIHDGGTILYVTKQWEEALKIADNISILTKGKIVEKMSAQSAKMDPKTMLMKLNDYNYKRNNSSNNHTKNVLDTVLKAAEFLTSEYELKDVLLLLAKEATRFMNADGCSIKLIDENTWSIIDDLEFKQKGYIQAQLMKEVIVKIAKKNDIFFANENGGEFESLFVRRNNVKTIICIPVLIRTQVTGIIQIYYEDFYVYSNDESRYLAALARHAAIAIEDTRLMGRSALLQESHHRIKNNLQSIVGIISLQRNFIQQNSTHSTNDILDNLISRIKSISSVHDLLSKDKLGRSIINVKEIIEEIIQFFTYNSNFVIHLDLDDIFIAYTKATSIALVINELVTNCFKHAFTNMNNGTICIQCKELYDHIFISVRDNGHGLPNEFIPSQVTSLGLSIIHGIITNEFKGEIKFKSVEGTIVEIQIPIKSLSLNQYRKKEEI